MLHESSNLLAAGIHPAQRNRGGFFRARSIVIVDSLCFSAALLCPGTVQVAWDRTRECCALLLASRVTSLMLPSALPFTWGLVLFFFPLGILGSAEFVLCFAEERAS